MATEVTTSKKYSVNWRDILQGLIMATITPVFVLVQNSLDAGILQFNWKQLGMAAVAGLLAYLGKRFFTPTQTIIAVKPALPDNLVKKLNDDGDGESGTEIPTKPPPPPNP